MPIIIASAEVGVKLAVKAKGVLGGCRGFTRVQLLPFLQQLLPAFLMVGVGYTAILLFLPAA